MDGWVDGKAGLRIAYNNKKITWVWRQSSVAFQLGLEGFKFALPCIVEGGLQLNDGIVIQLFSIAGHFQSGTLPFSQSTVLLLLLRHEHNLLFHLFNNLKQKSRKDC